MMQVELLLRLVERQFKIIIVKLWVDDIVPSVAQKRRLHAPWNGHPTMKEQYFHKASRLRRVLTQIGTAKKRVAKNHSTISLQTTIGKAAKTSTPS